MQSDTYKEISEQIDDAILVASNNEGRNIREIRRKNTIKEYYSPIFIGILPFISSFLIVFVLKKYFAFPEDKIFSTAVIIFLLLSFSSFFTIIFRQHFLDKKINKILETKVNIPYFIVDPIYSEIEPFLNIERSYDLSIKELDQLRIFFNEKIFLMQKDHRIGFLSPRSQ